MRCALCRQEHPLVRSHVIPEFLYRPLYDDKHQFHEFSSEPRRLHRSRQKGIYGRLLCAECDNRLSKYERYASLVFAGRIPIQKEKTGALVRVTGLDYKQFRLFGLSILWRAGVSNERMFSEVRLGAHEEVLRKIILRGEPPLPSKYGFFLSPLVHEGKSVVDLIVKPTPSRLLEHRCYRFVFGGIIWTYVVSGHAAPEAFRKFFLKENGEMTMSIWRVEDVPFVMRAVASLLSGPVGDAS